MPRTSYARTMTSRVLVLMRHAKSDWSGDEADLERPIGQRGRRQAAEAGAWLNTHVPAVQLVVTSPARRTRETWATASQRYDASPVVRVDERIYTWDARPVLDALRDVDEEVTVALLVGHNPGLDDLVADLTGEDVSMVTSALAVLTFAGAWPDLAAGGCALAASGRPPLTPPEW